MRTFSKADVMIDVYNKRLDKTPEKVYLHANVRWWAEPTTFQGAISPGSQAIILNDALELGQWINDSIVNGTIIGGDVITSILIDNNSLIVYTTNNPGGLSTPFPPGFGGQCFIQDSLAGTVNLVVTGTPGCTSTISLDSDNIPVTPIGNLTSITLQQALIELQVDIDNLNVLSHPPATKLFGSNTALFVNTVTQVINLNLDTIDSYNNTVLAVPQPCRLTSSTIQGAIDELATKLCAIITYQSVVTNNLNGTYSHNDGNGTIVIIDTRANVLPVVAVGNLTSTTVQTALEEIQTDIDILIALSHPRVTLFPGSNPALTLNGLSQQMSLNLSIAGSYNNLISGLTSTNIQSAIDELVNQIDNLPPGAVSILTNNGNGTYTHNNGLGTLVTIDIRASNIPVVPMSPGNLSSTTVQNALTELQTDIDNIHPSASLAFGNNVALALNPTTQVFNLDLDEPGSYDNTISGLTSVSIKDAIDELATGGGGTVLPPGTIKQILVNTGAVGGTTWAANDQPVIRVVTQSAHGFILPTYGFLPVTMTTGGLWILSKADAISTLNTSYIVDIIDVNTFCIQNTGYINAIGHSLIVGEYYFLSDTISGQIVTTIPTIENAICIPIDSSTIQLIDNRPNIGTAGSPSGSMSSFTIADATNSDIITDGETIRFLAGPGTSVVLSGSPVSTITIGVGGPIDNLTDVDTTTNIPVLEDIFIFNGTNWVPVEWRRQIFTAIGGETSLVVSTNVLPTKSEGISVSRNGVELYYGGANNWTHTFATGTITLIGITALSGDKFQVKWLG